MSALTTTSGKRPPALLSMAHWYGTLAAVRDLGRRGIDVYVASSRWLSHARWSRYARRRLRCPDERDAGSYASWLLELGRREPGTALVRTSDDVAFVHAQRLEDLTRAGLLLANPGLDVMRELLDKSRLQQHAERVGLSTPRTVFPDDAAQAAELARSSPWAWLIKQRTQVSSQTLHKGTPLHAAHADVRAVFEQFQRRNRFGPSVLQKWPGVDVPMLQEYLPECTNIYCLAGFLTPEGDRWATRAALKVLSHPRHLGVGLLFEHAPVLPDLEERVLRLCRDVGYHGTFQCEFLEHEGRHLLIDFNPRFYNYMAFDHARGLPQAYLAYLLATGAREELHRELEQARTLPSGSERMVYAYGVGTWTQLRMERLFRRIPREEPRRWRDWRRRAASVVDPVWERDDEIPWLVDVSTQLWNLLRHPRDFIRRNAHNAF
jgi:predicted ATP-grasp superfamily ATP-dependent carboligase